MNRFRITISILLTVIAVQTGYGFTDVTCFNSVLGQNNYFRVFTPLTYSASDHTKRYPVIYFLHGCRGSHQYGDSGWDTYPSLGLSKPTVNSAHGTSSYYSMPYNPDFENYVDSADVIIVTGNGNFAGGGCGAWEVLGGSSINLAALFKVLIDTVDSRYNTIASPAGRAITGVSLGGYAASFIAGNLPDHFLSASQFCRAPGPYLFNNTATNVDVNNFWRNFRRLPFRTSTNLWDYLRYYTAEMGQIMNGASPGSEYQLTGGLLHYAGDITRQLDFHRKYFKGAAIPATCISYINSYPDFNFNGYSVHSNKTDSGYIYFKDVTSNGFGVYTRRTLPFGKPFTGISLSCTTAAVLKPATLFSVNRYHYKGDSISTESATSDGSGRITLSMAAPLGQEIGISGDTLPPAVMMLLDTFSETRYLPNGKDTVIGIDVVNLSNQAVTATFTTSTENSDRLAVLNAARTITIPAKTRLHIDSLVTVRATWIDFPKNTAYLKVRLSLGGNSQQREYLIPLTILSNLSPLDTGNYAIMDGRTQTFSSRSVTEGIGNGNGIADSNEVISVWIYPPDALGFGDYYDFRPAVPCISATEDFSIEEIKTYSIGNRYHYSVLMRVKRSFSMARPFIVPFQSKCMWDESNRGMDNKSLQNYTQTYSSVAFPKEAIAVEEVPSVTDGNREVTVRPNPFNPAVTITLPGATAAEVAVYDIRGTRVADLTGKARNGKVTWNARGENGKAVPAGVYFVRVRSGKLNQVKRIAYLP